MLDAAERAEFIAMRRSGLGGSDAPAICGLSKWKPPLAIYLDKTDGKEEPMSEPQYWGLVHEPTIAKEYAKRTGHELAPAPKFWRHPVHSFMFANLDYIVLGEDKTLECKTAFSSDGWGPSGTDEVPDDYNIQTQHQMLCSGLTKADVAVLIAGNDFRIFHVQANPRIQTQLLQIEGDFWERVKRRIPPPHDWVHPETPKLVERLNIPEDGVELVADAERDSTLIGMVMALAEARAVKGEAEKQSKVLAARIGDHMGNASILLLPDGTRVKRQVISKKPYTVEPEPYTETRILKPKEKR